MSRALAVRACVVVVCAATSACGVSGLSFIQDKRVHIVTPASRAKVRLPLEVAWTVKDFDGSFGVLVDQAPPRSGETLPWLFRGNDTCRGATGQRLCASSAFLAENNVFQTRQTRFTVARVARFTGSNRRREFHEVTVVMLDAQGRRLGEGAWSVEFEVQRADD